MEIKNGLLILGMMLLLATFGGGSCNDSDEADVGDADADADGDTDTSTDYTITARLSLPADFTGTAVRLQVVYFDSFPPSGEPTVISEAIPSPAISPGTPYVLETTLPSDTAPGDYYLSVSLFVEGGGTSMPLAGVDYAGAAMTAISYPQTANVDAGNIPLNPYAGL